MTCVLLYLPTITIVTYPALEIKFTVSQSESLFIWILASSIFIFFHQIVTFQKVWKMLFISSEKLFWFSRHLFFFTFISTFSRFKMINENVIVYVSWIVLHKLADVNLGITQKALYITSSKLLIINKGIFLNLFCNLKRATGH